MQPIHEHSPDVVEADAREALAGQIGARAAEIRDLCQRLGHGS